MNRFPMLFCYALLVMVGCGTQADSAPIGRSSAPIETANVSHPDGEGVGTYAAETAVTFMRFENKAIMAWMNPHQYPFPSSRIGVSYSTDLGVSWTPASNPPAPGCPSSGGDPWNCSSNLLGDPWLATNGGMAILVSLGKHQGQDPADPRPRAILASRSANGSYWTTADVVAHRDNAVLVDPDADPPVYQGDFLDKPSVAMIEGATAVITYADYPDDLVNSVIWTATSDDYGYTWHENGLDLGHGYRARTNPIVKLVSETLGYICYMEYVDEGDQVRATQVRVVRITRDPGNTQWSAQEIYDEPARIRRFIPVSYDGKIMRDQVPVSFDIAQVPSDGDKSHLYIVYRDDDSVEGRLTFADVLASETATFNPDNPGSSSWRIRHLTDELGVTPGGYNPVVSAHGDTVAFSWYHLDHYDFTRRAIYSFDGLNSFSGELDISPPSSPWAACPAGDWKGDYVGAAIVPEEMYPVGSEVTPYTIEGIAHSTSCSFPGNEFHVQSIVW